MAWIRPTLLRRPTEASDPRRKERGATFTEYALVASFLIVASLGAITMLQDESGSYLADTGSDIGDPRDLAADLPADLPDAPAWLTPPPPPPPPTPGVIASGQMSSVSNTGKCFELTTPGVAGSTVDRPDCDGGVAQTVAATGIGTEVVLTFTDPVNDGLCISSEVDGSNRVKMQPCDGSDAQLWDLTDNGSSYTFVSRDTGMCLRSTNGGLEARPCNGNDDRNFIFA